jgi:hypothetical protein
MMLTGALVAGLLVAGACGSSTPQANKADVEAVIASVSRAGNVTRKQATCIAEKAVPHLSKQALVLVRDRSSDPTHLSTPDQKVIYASVSSCITTAQLAPTLAKAVASGDAKLTSSQVKCFTKAAESAYPMSGDLMRDAVEGKLSNLADAIGKCVPTSSIKEEFVKALTTGGGMTKAVAECVAGKVLAEVPLSDLANSASGAVPADIESKLVAAASECSNGG